MKGNRHRIRHVDFGRCILAALATLWLSGCEKAPPPPPSGPEQLVLTPVSFAEIPGWRGDTPSAALPAFALSCGKIMGRPDGRTIGPRGGGLAGTVGDWRPACAAIARVSPGDDGATRAAFETWFVPFKATTGAEDAGLFTGYYEAELRGAVNREGGYRIPIYRKPPDLIAVNLGRFYADLGGRRIVGRVEGGALVPYHTRGRIDDGSLGGRGLELLWADDPVDVFFLHVQGSGIVRLPDGRTRRVGFAASNGHDFFAIGRALLKESKIPPGRASMQGIRDWLRAHPEEAARVMRRNARYIFFRWIDGDGPIGAQGVPLTPGRSLAVDPKFLPLGAPIFLDTTWPGTDRPLRRLMIAQDVGGAIKGPLRGDFFWGSGDPALEQAGRMKQRGRLYLLLPKSVAERRRATS